MKVKCYTHDRRVMLIPNGNPRFEQFRILIHREDGSHCDSKTIAVGEKLMSRGHWEAMTIPLEDESILLTRQEEKTPAEELLKEIFEGTS